MDKNNASALLEICKRLHQKGWLASCDGNVSIRKSNGNICITPSGLNKAFIEASDLSEITLDDQILSGKPSSERLMHLRIYSQCEQAKAIVHAHPPVATAWSVAHPEMNELPSQCISEVILAVGSVPIVSYARPGTSQMGDLLMPYLPQNRVMILANHGAIAWGEDLNEAYNGIERLEHTALTLFYAKMLGGLVPLPAGEIEYLKQIRSRGNGRTL